MHNNRFYQREYARAHYTPAPKGPIKVKVNPRNSDGEIINPASLNEFIPANSRFKVKPAPKPEPDIPLTEDMERLFVGDYREEDLYKEKRKICTIAAHYIKNRGTAYDRRKCGFAHTPEELRPYICVNGIGCSKLTTKYEYFIQGGDRDDERLYLFCDALYHSKSDIPECKMKRWNMELIRSGIDFEVLKRNAKLVARKKLEKYRRGMGMFLFNLPERIILGDIDEGFAYAGKRRNEERDEINKRQKIIVNLDDADEIEETKKIEKKSFDFTDLAIEHITIQYLWALDVNLNYLKEIKEIDDAKKIRC